MGLIKIPSEAKDHFLSKIGEILNSGNLAESEWNNKLRDIVVEKTNMSYAVPTSSNGSGIVAGLNILNKYENRKYAILQENTMYGVKAMVQSANYEIIGYLKCAINTLMPTYDDFHNFISNNPIDTNKIVLLLSHLGGILNPDIERITKLCEKHNIALVEDCAHSFMSTLNGRHSGGYGKFGVYSFYATKAIPGGEGGIMVTHNKEFYKIFNKYVIYDRFDQNQAIGNNIRQSEINALFLYSVIMSAEEIIKDKKYIHDLFKELCNKNNIDFIDQYNEGMEGNNYKFIITSDDKISERYPQLKTKTSAIYDYIIGESNSVYDKHYCLPTWYAQNHDKIYEKVSLELLNGK